MIIDAHTHVFHPDFIRNRESLLDVCPWFAELYSDPNSKMSSAEDLLDEMDRSGVDKSVVLGFAWHDKGRMRTHNDYLVESAEKSDGRLLPFIMVIPTDMDFTEKEINRLAGRGVKGIGELMPDGQGYHLTRDSSMDGVMDLARSHDLPVMIHTDEPVGHDYPGKGRVLPSVMWGMIDRFPDVKVICGHWGGGLVFYEMMPEVARQLRNVYYDSAASTLLYDDRIFGIAARIARKKILFGSDYHVIGQKRILARSREALADNPEALADFLGTNAQRLFGE